MRKMDFNKDDFQCLSDVINELGKYRQLREREIGLEASINIILSSDSNYFELVKAAEMGEPVKDKIPSEEKLKGFEGSFELEEELKRLLSKWNGEWKTIKEHYGEDSVCRAIRKHIDELKSILKNFGAKINM